MPLDTFRHFRETLRRFVVGSDKNWDNMYTSTVHTQKLASSLSGAWGWSNSRLVTTAELYK